MNAHNFVVTFSSSIKKIQTLKKKKKLLSKCFGLFVFSVNRNIFYYNFLTLVIVFSGFFFLKNKSGITG